jgi:diguanylate cyclase (GGDEF)-like protein
MTLRTEFVDAITTGRILHGDAMAISFPGIRTPNRPCAALRQVLAVYFLPLLFLAILTVAPCVALTGHKQITQYVQTALTDQNGLPQNSVNAIAQTRDGYLWFGTEEGLARYDGLRVTVFDTIHNVALKDNYIQALATSRDGSLWIGTRTGLTRFKDGEFQTYLTAQSPITTVLEAQDGQIWVGSMDGLYSVQPGRGPRLYTTRDGLPGNSIRSIVQAADGILWVGTAHGLASLNSKLDPRVFHLAGLPAESVQALATVPDGSLWIATGHSLFRWNGQRLESVPIAGLPPHARITTLHADVDSGLWIGFDHSGLLVLHNGQVTAYTARQGLPSNDISAIFEDREGHLWIGLFESGAVELRDGSFTTIGHSEGLSDNMTWSVLEARDKSLWVGTNSQGLDHVTPDGAVRVYSTRDGLPGDSIYALFEAPNHSVWIGGEDGALTHLQNNHITVYRDPDNKGQRITTILQYPGGTDLLIGYHETNGLTRFNPAHPTQFQHFTVPGLLNTANLAPDGSVWVGTDHAGVSRLNLATGALTSFTSRNGLLTNFAQAIYVDRDGVVWAGTSPGGLNRIKDGHITTYSIEQGLFDLTVGAIVEDNEGNLWMTCNKGIYKVSKKELNDYADGRIRAIHSIVYGAADGLRSVECNFAADPSVWKAADGRLWFATTAGIASIDPAHSRILTRTPPLLIEQVLFRHSWVHLISPNSIQSGSQPITVGPGSGDLEIRFTAPDFVAPQRIHFRYRLRGSDADWVDVGDRRQAFYTNLPPGKYFFEVEGAIGDQNWSPQSAMLAIIIQPHFWQTALFRALCAIILMLVATALYRLRVRYYIEHNRTLEDRVNERTAELQLAIHAAEAAHSALSEQASHDSLTGLWNRRSIFEMLAKELHRAQRDQHSLAVLMVDVDHFKLVNDTHGHLSGDTVLQQVAKRIHELTRSYDFAGRYGGEEFVIALSRCSLMDGLERAEEFRHVIASEPIPANPGPLLVTCSIGVAISTPGDSAEDMVRKADEALYAAKRAGRNRVHAISPQLPTIPDPALR